MQKPSVGFASLLAMFALSLTANEALAQKTLTLETAHYKVGYEKKHSQLAGEVLKVAEAVWPTLAKAYDSYDRYQRINILITDDGDDANGYAIYNFSRVVIFAPHMDWVMRNRQLWIQNVVTHELAHVFSLRRAAWLSPVDAVELYGSTYNYTDRVNYSFHLPWVPLVAPTWYVEGIAQFEAYMNENDSWDSQRDMVVRDAYLTGTLPSLDFIETFEGDEDWTQAERCYNTGYAFLIYLKDRFGADKVRALARPKPLLNFSWSVYQAFGRDLTDLFEDFKRSLADRYADFKEIPKDSLADRDMVGGYQQNLAFSPDGKYVAWLGNGEDRRYPLNWIFWKPVGSATTHQSGKPADAPSPQPAAPSPAPTPSPAPAPAPAPQPDGFFPGMGPVASAPGVMPMRRLANPSLALGKQPGPLPGGPDRYRNLPSGAGRVHESHGGLDARRSDEFGSSGLEFNHANNRLLTTRQDRYAQFTDIWEYEFRADKSESKKWHRLTWEERAAYPSYHPQRELIVYSRKSGGTSNIALLDSNGRTWQLTNFSGGEQVYNPRFTPKGDSIYFTLGLADKEAIVSINAEAPAFNPFMAIKDSSQFPDSLPVAKGQKLAFATDWRKGALRHLRFQGDTLYFSSNAEDSVYSVYDVYARVPGDSVLWRATHVAGQAMEPLVRNGTLYYQGFRRQQFRIFTQPLDLKRTGTRLGQPKDTLPTAKAKKMEYEKVFETGEFSGTKVALDITPFLAVQPVFLSGNQAYTDFVMGLNLAFGESYGGWMQSVSGAMTKRTRLDAPLNYQFTYNGYLTGTAIKHATLEWTPALYYSVYHDIIESNNYYNVKSDTFALATNLFQDRIQTWYYFHYSRWAASAGMPLPYNFVAQASYWEQFVTADLAQDAKRRNVATGEITDAAITPRFLYLNEASQHRHYESSLGWGWSKGMLGTYLPTGGGVYGYVHKYWATYQDQFAPLDTVNVVRLSQEGKPAPFGTPVYKQYDPWTIDGGVGGIYSIGKYASLFANAEAGLFLNNFPTTLEPVHETSTDTIRARQPHPLLWVLAYRLGYYRMSGYPYNFNYRGRDIMEGSFFTFGQAGVQVPLKFGRFISGWPTTSIKQFMLTGISEWGTTMQTTPDAVGDSLWTQQYQLLLDVGLRLSANFKLYHQWPFTVYAQVFQPINNLKAANLYSTDYPILTRREKRDLSGAMRPETDGELDARSRDSYMDIVKVPRFYVGFNLGLF